jgi:hypothetical protein
MLFYLSRSLRLIEFAFVLPIQLPLERYVACGQKQAYSEIRTPSRKLGEPESVFDWPESSPSYIGDDIHLLSPFSALGEFFAE